LVTVNVSGVTSEFVARNPSRLAKFVEINGV
jgi:hypothetical protein